MGKRTYESDIVAMALLYRKEYVGSDMISYEKAVQFDQVINENLNIMNSDCGIGIGYSYYDNSKLFTKMTDENGNLYAVIIPNADLEEAWRIHIGCLPTDVIIASQMDNALGVIELEKKIDESTKRICFTQKNNDISKKKELIKKKLQIGGIDLCQKSQK